MTLPATRTKLVGPALLGLVVALLFVAAPAVAQTPGEANLKVSADSPSGDAMPGGDPATVPITISYDCLGLVSGDVALAAEVLDGGGTATLADQSFAVKILPDCTPGTPVEETTTLSYSATADALAEVPITIEVTATASGIDGAEVKDSTNVTVKAGPMIDVTFTPTVTDFEVAAGESFDVLVEIQSNSNTMVMAMPVGIDNYPSEWLAPDIVPMNIPSPLAEGDGSSAFEFTITVPPTAEAGEHNMVFTPFAHTLSQTYLETEKAQIPINLKVTPGTSGGGGGEDEAEEGPLFSPVPLLVAALGLAALARRRL